MLRFGLCLFFVAALAGFSYADVSTHLNITEEDGVPSTFPYKAKFSNGTVTDNGDGTVSISNSGGGGGGTPGGSSGNIQYNNAGSFGGASFFNVSGSSTTSSGDMIYTTSAIGPVLTDANSCTWRTTVTTAGNLVTTLLGCPVVATARSCTPGVPIGILMSIVCPRS